MLASDGWTTTTHEGLSSGIVTRDPALEQERVVAAFACASPLDES